MANRWSPDFLDLLTASNDADARHLLVGGHAPNVASTGGARARTNERNEIEEGLTKE